MDSSQNVCLPKRLPEIQLGGPPTLQESMMKIDSTKKNIQTFPSSQIMMLYTSIYGEKMGKTIDFGLESWCKLHYCKNFLILKTYKVKLATTNNIHLKENVLLVQAYVDQDPLLISSLLQQMNLVQGLNPAYHYTEMK